MPAFLSIKTFIAKQVLKLAPKIGKAFLNSILGKNRGEVIPYRQQGNKNVICFVHGFNGSAKDTFFKFPEILSGDKAMDGWDMFSIGYATDMMPTFKLGLWAELPYIPKLADYMRTVITKNLKGYSQIAFVGHSMGGLVLQRAILDLDENTSKSIKYFFLYGTPSAGLVKAKFARWIRNSQINDMTDDSDFITGLRRDWNARFSQNLPFTFLTVAGDLDEFVPEKSSTNPFPLQYRVVTTGNHVDMVKPDSINHPSYQIIQKTIIEEKPFLKTFKSQDLNNLLGDYAKIIADLENKIDVIAPKYFKEYIFALEGYKNVEQSIAALEKYNRVNTDTDFMGILGGRYKRKFFTDKLEANKNKAVEFYKKGYDQSKGIGDKRQIHYHAINLAFLYLFGDNNRDEMKKYATEALNSASLIGDPDKWDTASKAEASIYLNKFDDAKKYYTEAIQISTGDERAISSMYLNAYNACIALDKNDWAKEIDKIFKRN